MKYIYIAHTVRTITQCFSLISSWHINAYHYLHWTRASVWSVPVSFVQLCVGGCVCLPVWDGAWTFAGPKCARFSLRFVCNGSCVHCATHLPYDKEDESSAQHQGEHVAEGRKGERHGCASQPDDQMGWEREKGTCPLCSLSLCCYCSLSLFTPEEVICSPLWCKLSPWCPGG